jgi:hypothetical protein
MIRTLNQTFDHYQQLRGVCYQHTLEQYQGSINAFNLDEISFNAAQTADSWKNIKEGTHRQHRSKWSWMSMHNNYRRHPKRFDIAVWQAGQLCGLSYGIPTKRKTKLRLELVEASPLNDNPLRSQVMTIVTSAAINYAMLLGADELRVMNPVNENVTSYYKKLGYKPVRNRLGKTEYSFMKLEY